MKILGGCGHIGYLIEYDGVQHFQDSCFGADEIAFETQQKHDQIKNIYCKEHDIPLIRIPFTKLKDLTIRDLIYLQGNKEGDDLK